MVEPGADEEHVVALAREDENVIRHLEGMAIVRVVHVADRLVNFVVRPA